AGFLLEIFYQNFGFLKSTVYDRAKYIHDHPQETASNGSAIAPPNHNSQIKPNHWTDGTIGKFGNCGFVTDEVLLQTTVI
uniref:hypothetical protein n=1 Tax=Argonema antarcticum TaxID=2942763 RepID=UPI0020134E19